MGALIMTAREAVTAAISLSEAQSAGPATYLARLAQDPPSIALLAIY